MDWGWCSGSNSGRDKLLAMIPTRTYNVLVISYIWKSVMNHVVIICAMLCKLAFVIRKSGQVETWPTWLEATPLQAEGKNKKMTRLCNGEQSYLATALILFTVQEQKIFLPILYSVLSALLSHLAVILMSLAFWEIEYRFQRPLKSNNQKTFFQLLMSIVTSICVPMNYGPEDSWPSDDTLARCAPWCATLPAVSTVHAQPLTAAYMRGSSNLRGVLLLVNQCQPGFWHLHIRTSKSDPLMDEVQLLQANPQYTHVHVRYADGRETTVSVWHLAPRFNGRICYCGIIHRQTVLVCRVMKL